MLWWRDYIFSTETILFCFVKNMAPIGNRMRDDGVIVQVSK
jgi:hypothetical protein